MEDLPRRIDETRSLIEKSRVLSERVAQQLRNIGTDAPWTRR
jgi:hypothetical protein